MFSTAPRGSYIDERISRTYCKDVLLANWQELRLGSQELNDCVTPGLKKVNACIRHKSEAQDSYVPPHKLEEPTQTKRQFLAARNESLHNFKRNRSSQLCFNLDEDMVNNYTTTYNIMFDILPRQAKEEKATMPVNASIVPSRPEQRDLMLSYGNRTKTGSRCRLMADMYLDKLQRLQTTYAAEYEQYATGLSD
ncbi:hypothetical protein AWZ03_000023 [Drosophila navojoa]|uniref:Uncharacterized protein n=1 Tax=Drosophila navojoa TaxID=7232 RepID=A0A484BWK8_DRONA|nr:uncharacterized protein LOC108650109 [Drosophila navojoa]TDG53208.1 hypothetical protein AWZ03_000023 [Drosophila navojoa]